MKKTIISILIGIFSITSLGANPVLTTTPEYAPFVLRGIQIDSNDPFKLNFLIDEGDTSLDEAEIKEEAQKHINYFLASLTIPEEDLWVNLSPYEKDKIIPEELSLTDMGADMLAQDYTLKQLLSSLTYPESELGKQFWSNVYKQVQAKLGTTNIPIDTFNKVWIVPEKAVVYEDGNLAFIGETKLKVLLEEDYLALKNSENREPQTANRTNQISSQVMKQTILPIIEQEVNQGEHFSRLRKIYHALILASWYKDRLREGFISKAYANQRKIKGIDLVEPQAKQDIYDQYVQAYKKGVYNYIRNDYSPRERRYIKRRYYSGGLGLLVSVVREDKPAEDREPNASSSASVTLAAITARDKAAIEGAKQVAARAGAELTMKQKPDEEERAASSPPKQDAQITEYALLRVKKLSEIIAYKKHHPSYTILSPIDREVRKAGNFYFRAGLNHKLNGFLHSATYNPNTENKGTVNGVRNDLLLLIEFLNELINTRLNEYKSISPALHGKLSTAHWVRFVATHAVNSSKERQFKLEHLSQIREITRRLLIIARSLGTVKNKDALVRDLIGKRLIGNSTDAATSSAAMSADEFEKGLIDIFDLEDHHIQQGSVRCQGRDYAYTMFQTDLQRYSWQRGPVYFRAGDIFVLNATIDPWAKVDFNSKDYDSEEWRRRNDRKERELQQLLKRFPKVIKLYESTADHGNGGWIPYTSGTGISGRVFWLPHTIGVLIAMQANHNVIRGHTFIDAFSRNGLMANAAFILGASDAVVIENDYQEVDASYLHYLIKGVKFPEKTDLIRANLIINGNLDKSKVHYKTIRQVPEDKFENAVLAYSGQDFGFDYMEASQTDRANARKQVPIETLRWEGWLSVTPQGKKIMVTERSSLLRDIREKFKGVRWIIASGGTESGELKSYGVTQKLIDEAKSLNLFLHSKFEIKQSDSFNLIIKKQTLIMPTLTFKGVRRRTTHRQGKAAVSSSTTTGGIDLNTDYLTLSSRGQKFSQSFSNLPYSIDDIEGFTFTISSIKKYPSSE